MLTRHLHDKLTRQKFNTTLTRQIQRDAQTPWGQTDINTTI